MFSRFQLSTGFFERRFFPFFFWIHFRLTFLKLFVLIIFFQTKTRTALTATRSWWKRWSLAVSALDWAADRMTLSWNNPVVVQFCKPAFFKHFFILFVHSMYSFLLININGSRPFTDFSTSSNSLKNFWQRYFLDFVLNIQHTLTNACIYGKIC